ncbi:uncharacterized protein [Montipora foliosa]|uniref:uncharacterized protein n=1 Tax=Montipora foliosa TaxID=591990 RepID=UPI0035F21134
MTQTEEIKKAKPSVPKYVPAHGPHQMFTRRHEEALYQVELGLIKGTKVLCSLDLLVQQLGGNCRHTGCIFETVVDYTLCGTSAMIRWKCPAGHIGRFCTSGEVNNVLSNNLQAAAAVLLSGNNFAKVERFAKFLGLSFISSSTFFRVQKLYCIPAIDEWWQWMRGELLVEFQNKELVVSGDGQCDSPGFSAKNLCYYLMEIVTEYILEVEVLDKRHVGMKSSTMETKALKNALERLKGVANVVEVCTDASSSIKKLLAENFKDIFHSLDIWHKAKSIRKCIQKVANNKGNEKIAKWSDHIINHFWYCCSTASNSDSLVNATSILKNKWIGLPHHVCNDHEWTGGQCDHGEMTEDGGHPPWFDRRDKDFVTLQKIILEPILLESFKYYVKFRHTGSLECAKSMSLGYTLKRCSYNYQVYKGRRQLAAVDWNYHINRPISLKDSGEAQHTRKYNQRTKEWNTRVVKVSNDFAYIPILMAKIFKQRIDDRNPVDRHVSLSEDDPARIAPTIAQVPPVSSKELFIKHKSRFTK